MPILNSIFRLMGWSDGSSRIRQASQIVRNKLDDDEAQQDRRLNRYHHNWQIYLSRTLEDMETEDEGSTKPLTNWIRHNIDKVNWWAWGREVKVLHEDYQQYLDLASTAWGHKMVIKMLRMGQFGSVTGDAFIMVAPSNLAKEIEDAGAGKIVVSPSDKVTVVIVNSAYCEPVYDGFDSESLVMMRLTVPQKVYDPMNDRMGYSIIHMTITDEKVYTYHTDVNGAVVEESRSEEDNPIKQVYCLHTPNAPLGDSVFGADDIYMPSHLNKEYNDKSISAGKVIDYHGAPITCVFGAKVGNLSKGPNKLWSNLPKDGKVENLGLDGELEATNNYLGGVKENIHVVMGVPEIANGTNQAISNTSGVALHTMYLPLIERVKQKWEIYSPNIVESYILAIKWLTYRGELKVTGSRGRKRSLPPLTEEDYERIRAEAKANWELPLPKDKLIEAQVVNTKIQAKIISRKEGRRQLGEENVERIEKELEEEAEYDLEHARTMAESQAAAKAAQGETNQSQTDDDPDDVNKSAQTGENTGDSDSQKGRPKGSRRP